MDEVFACNGVCDFGFLSLNCYTNVWGYDGDNIPARQAWSVVGITLQVF